MFTTYKKLLLNILPMQLMENPGVAENSDVKTDTTETIQPVNLLKEILKDGKLNGQDLKNIESLKAKFDAPSEEAQGGLSELKESIKASVSDMLKNGYTIGNESDYKALVTMAGSTNIDINMPAYNTIAETLGDKDVFSLVLNEAHNTILVYKQLVGNITWDHGTIDLSSGKFTQESWNTLQNNDILNDQLGNNNEISIDGLDQISDDMKIEALMKRYDEAQLLIAESPEYKSDYVKTVIEDYPSLAKVEDLIFEINEENKNISKSNREYADRLIQEEKARVEELRVVREKAENEKQESEAKNELSTLYPESEADLAKYVENIQYTMKNLDAILSVVSLEEDEIIELSGDLENTQESMIDLEENIALGNDSVETLASLKALLNDLSVEDLQSISDAVDNHKELIADQQEQRELQKQLEQQEINEKEEKKNDIQQELERKTKVNELIKEYRGNKDFQNDSVISKLFETTIIVSRKTTPDELAAFEDAMDNKLEGERKSKVNELIREYRGNKDLQNDPVISKLFETTIIVSRKTTPDELVAFENEISEFEKRMDGETDQKVDNQEENSESFIDGEKIAEVGNTVKEWINELFEGHPDLAQFTSEAGDEIIIEYNKLTNTISIDTAWLDGVMDYDLELSVDIKESDLINDEASAKEYVSSRVAEIKQKYEEKYTESQNTEPLIDTEKLSEAMVNFKEWIAELFEGNPDLATFVSEAGHDILVEYNKETNSIEIDTAWGDGVSDYDLQISMDPNNLEYVRDELSAKKFVDTRLQLIEAEYNNKFQTKAIDRILNTESKVANYKQIHGLDVELTKNDKGEFSLQLVTLFGDRVADSDVRIPLDRSVLEGNDFATLDKGVDTLLNKYENIFQNETIDLILDTTSASETLEILEDGSQLQVVSDDEGKHYIQMLAPKGSDAEIVKLPIETTTLVNKDKKDLNKVIANVKEEYNKVK